MEYIISYIIRLSGSLWRPSPHRAGVRPPSLSPAASWWPRTGSSSSSCWPHSRQIWPLFSRWRGCRQRCKVTRWVIFIVDFILKEIVFFHVLENLDPSQNAFSGLEELAQQSKINYTVVQNSPYLEYFKNMAGAEEDLYKVWKDLTLSSNADQSRLGDNLIMDRMRVWIYQAHIVFIVILTTIHSHTARTQVPRLGLPHQGAVHSHLQDDPGVRDGGDGREGIPEGARRRGRNIRVHTRRVRGTNRSILQYVS